MLFNSFHYLYFFVALFFLYFKVVPDKWKWLLLLIASCYFYMVYIPEFVLILFFLITVDYFLGKQIASSVGTQRKLMLILSILANLGTLFFFKYFNFFNENVSEVAQLIHWNYSPLILQIALPLGLSFHIFQSLSYVIEVYKGKQEPEKHYGIYALYVMFFPQLVAGPIERPQHLLHQFHEKHSFSAEKARRGLELMLWGFFKKLVIADWIAQIVNHAYLNIAATDGLTLFIVAILFSYQIYCDFSGYSDIAVGSALVFGYDLTQNFNRPFASRSIAEFWRRWHISLSNWLKDYLYYPLAFAGKRLTKFRLYMSLFVTFTLIGLWHGASWTYVVFGMIHGILLVLSLVTEGFRKKVSTLTGFANAKTLQQVWQTVLTFLLVTGSFIFFRAANIPEALLVLQKIGISFLHLGNELMNMGHVISFESLGVPVFRLTVILFFVAVLESVQYFQARAGTQSIFDGKSKWFRWTGYYALSIAILFFGYLHAQSFIYFQF